MIRIKTKIKDFNLKTSFSDLTFSEFKELINEHTNEERRIEILTGLNPVECSYINLEDLSKYLSFIYEDPFEKIEASDFISIGGKDLILPASISSCQWGQKILSVQALREGNFSQVLAIYLQPILDEAEFDIQRLDEAEKLIDESNAESIISCFKFIKDQLIEIFEREKALKSDISGEQIAAGIDMFNILGDFNTIDLIAGGDVLKYEAVLKIDFDTIFNKLLKINLTAKFEKNYHEIINKK